MWQRRILLWTDAHRSLPLLAAPALAILVATAALAIAAAQSSHRSEGARSPQQQATLSRPRQAAARPAVTSTVVSSAVAAGCGKGLRDLGAASRAAGRLLVQFMAYSLGRLGARPAFPDATASFREAIWGMPHSPPPALAGAPVTVTLTSAELTAPGIAVVRFSVRIERPGLTAFPMLVAVSLRGCRWRAGGF
jgi:hypothetical protein